MMGATVGVPPPRRQRVATGLTGTAGEYYVAAELSRRGWLATVTVKNAPGTDVLAQHSETRRVIAIQTKTARSPFHFQLKGPKTIDQDTDRTDERTTENDNEWYVFASLRGETERPDFYIVPRNIVAAMISTGHRHWLAATGKRGPRKDSTMRNLEPESLETFREQWESLKLPTTGAGLSGG
jgi:hypothetical protein